MYIHAYSEAIHVCMMFNVFHVYWLPIDSYMSRVLCCMPIQLAYSSHRVIKTELYSLPIGREPAKYVLSHSSHSQPMHLIMKYGKMVRDVAS